MKTALVELLKRLGDWKAAQERIRASTRKWPNHGPLSPTQIRFLSYSADSALERAYAAWQEEVEKQRTDPLSKTYRQGA